MILVDFSGILFQNVFGSISAVKPQIRENGKYDVKDFMNVAKSFMMNFLFDIQQQYSSTKGDIVICLDNTREGNWRKDYLSTYKSARKDNRQNSEIPFDEVFKEIDELVEQIKENTPWKVISVPRAEADDIILCLSKQFSCKEPVLIISSDKDMIQAQKHGNVEQYSPLLRKFLTPESKGGDMNFWLTEHVVLGDVADEVPKITSNTEFSKPFKEYLKSKNCDYTEKEYNNLPNEVRLVIEEDYNVLDKKGNKDIWKNIKLGPKTVQKMLDENTLEDFINSNPLYKENYERNKILVLDDYIPMDIMNECVINFVSQKKSLNGENTEKFKKYLNDCGLYQLVEVLPLNFIKGTISIEDLL